MFPDRYKHFDRFFARCHGRAVKARVASNLDFYRPCQRFTRFKPTRAAAIKRRNDRNVIENRAHRRSENRCENTRKSYAKAIDATKPVHSPEIFQITPFRPPKTMPRASWGETRRAKSGSHGPRLNAKHSRDAKRSTDSPQKSAKARPRARKQAEVPEASVAKSGIIR